MTVKSGSQKAQILIALRTVWPDGGFTGYKLSTRGLVLNEAGDPISPNQTCTRLLELRDSGLAEFKREFPGGPIVEAVTTPGNTGQVHRLTDQGFKTVTGLLAASNRLIGGYGDRTKDPYVPPERFKDN